jgi:hypothetical protein
MCRAAAIALLLALAVPAEALAALPDGLAGRWAGTWGEEAVEATLHERRDGFDMDLSAPGAPRVQAQMATTNQPNLFEVAATRSMFGLFESERSTDPFDGPPLIWARTSEASLIAYRVAVAEDGSLSLVRIALEPTSAGLEMSLQLRVDGAVTEEWNTVLERVE